MAAGTMDSTLERQVAAARRRRAKTLTGRERRTRVAAAAGFLVAAPALATLAPAGRHSAWWWYAAFVVLYALASRVRIEVGTGVALPTVLVLVPMLFELPPRDVPVVVAVGLVGASLVDWIRGRVPLDRALSVLGSCWFAFGPAVVLSLAGAPVAGWASAPVVAAALAAQIACDAASATASEWFALRVSPRDLARPLAGAFVIDILLAPVGFAAAIAERNAHGASALPLPVLLVLVLFARERRRRLDNAIELSTAYRGTAFLLGDVVEADDAYTGHHSRQVVDLVLDVCDRLRLDERSRRDAEFVALLHDVGKIRIPTEIIGKPGPLTLEERAVIETHTVEGERLLKRVGGLLAEIGTVVRSCHERWDGAGYPDGLAGDAIPLIARIVCACDAFDAMTSDRPYRPARSTAEALGELVANRGTQFDPRVVDALVEAVVAASTAAMTPAAFDVCPGCGRTTALAAPAAGGQVVCVRCGLVDAAVAAA